MLTLHLTASSSPSSFYLLTQSPNFPLPQSHHSLYSLIIIVPSSSLRSCDENPQEGLQFQIVFPYLALHEKWIVFIEHIVFYIPRSSEVLAPVCQICLMQNQVQELLGPGEQCWGLGVGGRVSWDIFQNRSPVSQVPLKCPHHPF